MNTEKVYILEDRAILYINGLDSEKFLQNLISNDIKKVNESKSCFASLLSPQGKFLFDFIVIKHKEGYFVAHMMILRNLLQMISNDYLK